MKAYFYLAMALNAGMVAELKPQLEAIPVSPLRGSLTEVPHSGVSAALLDGDIARPYRAGNRVRGSAFSDWPESYPEWKSRQRIVELRRAHELLPDSTSISLVLANVLMSYARFADALAAFDRVLSAGPDDAALVGRARALSYLRRHDEAIAVLDETLKDLQTNPGRNTTGVRGIACRKGNRRRRSTMPRAR